MSEQRTNAKFGGELDLTSASPERVIFNFSDRILSAREQFLISFGLDFNLPIFKPSFYRYFLPYERFMKILERCQLAPRTRFDILKQQIKHVAMKSFYSFKSNRGFSPIFNMSDIQLLRSLGKDNSLVICSPDKGKGVVILNKASYISKMQQILADGSKFLELTYENMFTLVLKLEDKINRFLSDMKKAGKITDSIYRHLYASGSSPGILYGLPKIHKPDVPLRPILAAYNTAMYNLAKFLIPLIEQFSTNDFTLKNSYQFYDQISSLNLPSNSFMASFDISSLYTNVPVLETIKIICDSVFNNDSIFHNFTKEDFRKLLHLAVDDTYFIFNETLYKQTDGLSIGNPIPS